MEAFVGRISQILRQIRQEAGQASWVIRDFGDLQKARLQWKVGRAIAPTRGPRAKVEPGSVWGVTMVRDERDIVGRVVQHLLDQGIAGLIIADHGSVDGTFEILQDLAAQDPRVHLVRNRWPTYEQAEAMTVLAARARRAGADWIVPFDADEFWFADGVSLAEYFAELSRTEPDTTVLHADWLTMLPTRATDHIDSDTEFILDAHPVFPGKVAVKSHPLLVIHQGNHDVVRVGHRRRSELSIAHAIYRGPHQVARKFRQGAAAKGHLDGAWHWNAGAALSDEAIDDLWASITSGGAAPEVAIDAVGPMVPVQPQNWRTWDPDGVIAESVRDK